jgi:DNA-binding NarL/FixJ family response regulator
MSLAAGGSRLPDVQPAKRPTPIQEAKPLREILSAREMQVVGLVVHGRSNKEIAASMHLTEHTVKNYIFAIFRKIGCDNRITLAVRFVREEECTRSAANVGQVGYVEHTEVRMR